MNTSPPPELTPEVLARGHLQQKKVPQLRKNSLFEVLYDFLLFAAIPLAFEMSYVKIFQHTINAYEVNDTVTIGRLVVYLVIQWLLGIMVRRKYIGTTLKRITLVLMIMIQLKEAFFEEVLLDMMLSMILESGLAVLLFIKFAQLMVILKLMVLLIAIFHIVVDAYGHPLKQMIIGSHNRMTSFLKRTIMQTMNICMFLYCWHTHSYARVYTH